MTRKLIPDLLPNTQYAIQVRAVGTDSVSPWSQRKTFFTITDTILPAVPTSPTWAVNGNAFHGEWNAVTLNENGDSIAINRYEIELVAGATTKIDSVVPATGSSKVTYDLSFEQNLALFGTPQPIITFRVRAVDNKDLKSNWTSPTLTATNAAPAAPTGPAVGSVATPGTDTINLAWTAAADNDIVGYNVYTGATSGFTPSSANKIYAGLSTRISYTTTTYSLQYFKIRSVDVFGQESTDLTGNTTPISGFGADTIAPAVPTSLAATLANTPNESGAVAQVTWTMTSPPSDLAGFVIRYRKTGSTNWSQMITEPSARAATITLDQAYTDYDFQIQAFDWQNNYSAFTGTATGSGGSNTAPSKPAVPTVTTNTMQMQVVHGGFNSVGVAMEADVIYYEVYASTTNGFTPATANMLGTIANGPAIIGTFNIPANGGTTNQTWYVVVKAMDRGGLRSVASNQVTSTVGLVAGTNIVDATITNAKINDLQVNKLTGGVINTTDITVKSKLVVGDASSAGAIESFGYVAGTTGFHLDKTLLEINQGSIAAAALKIQDSQNLLPAEYADWEAYPSFYLTDFVSYAFHGAVSTNARFNNQYAFQTWAAGGAGQTSNVYLGKSITDYNTPVESSSTYIVSAYFRKNSGTVQNLRFIVKDNSGGSTTLTPNVTTITATGSTWQRSWATFTTNSTTTSVMLGIQADGTVAGDLHYDGMQIERQIGALTTPSPWTPPGMTSIRGDNIRTGSITSTGLARIVLARPVYDDGGVITSLTDTLEIDDPNARPAWTINAQGNAEFSNLSIRGNAVIGLPTPVQDTTYTMTVTVNTTSGSAIVTSIDGTFQSADATNGTLISGAGIPAGAKIIAVTNTATATISANATATATGITATMTRAGRYVSALSSADYIPGSRGWTVRSDGTSEFRSMVADSLDGIAIRAGTLDAGAIKTGTMEADITLSGSFQTASNPTELTASLTSGSPTVTLDASTPAEQQFTSSDVGIVISGDGILDGPTIISVTSGFVATMSINANATNSTANIRLYRGRTASLSGDGGLVLTDQYGNDIVTLPTDPTLPNYFAGSIEATDLFVHDQFRMFGLNNSLGQASILTLEGGQYKPATSPNVAFSYYANYLKDGNGGPRHSLLTDPYQNLENGAYYDYVTGYYYWLSTIYGAFLCSAVGPTFGAAAEGTFGFTINLTNAMDDPNDWMIGGVAADATNFHFLTRRSGLTTWKHQSISRTGINRAGGPVAGDRTNNHAWADALSGGLNGYPKIEAYGGNMYAAKLNSANQIVIYKYTGSNMNATAVKSTNTGKVTSGTMMSLRVGQFDFGTGSTYVIVTMQGASSAHRQHYVFTEGTTEFLNTNYTFPIAYDKTTPLGLTYVGTSANDGTGYFKGIDRDGYIYQYTKLGATSSSTTINTTQRWRSTTTPAIGPEGPVGTYGYKKRSNMTINSKVPIPSTGGSSPNAVTFYIGEGNTGTRYRYDEQSAGVIMQIVNQFRTTDASGTATVMASGVPATISSSAGLSITGDGMIAADTITVVNTVDGPYMPQRSLAGTATISLSAQAVNDVTVTFPAGYFTSAPRVVATVFATSVFFAYVTATPTATGCIIGVRRWDGVAVTTSVNVHYWAVQN